MPRPLTFLAGIGFVALLATQAPLPVAAADMGGWFKPGVPFTQTHPDPSVTSLGPMLFSYATNHGGPKLPVEWSADATTWTARTQYEGSGAYQGGDTHGWYSDALPTAPWGSGTPKELWAPSVAFVGTHWVAYHAVRIAPDGQYSAYGRFAIYVSTASNPLGPFTAVSSSPIVTTSVASDPAGALDPDVYVDEVTQKPYLLWKTEGNLSGNYPAIWSRQLNSSGTGFASGSSARKLISVSQGWEGNVVENPSLTKVGGRYVLLYSGNEFKSSSYATGWASCSSPLGPCSKSASNPILRSTAGAWGPGGADGIVDARGRFLAVYHANTSSSYDAGQRRQHVAELTSSGSVKVIRRDVAGGAGPDSLWSYSRGGGVRSTSVSVGGTYQPATGDFNGDGHDDVYWYAPWSGQDVTWMGSATVGRFTTRSTDQAGTLIPIPGDFNADGKGDLYWYQPGADPKAADPNSTGSDFERLARNDELWLSTGSGWNQRDLSMPWAALPIAGDFDGNGATDILWSQPGAAADRIWFFDRSGTPTSRTVTVNGDYRPVVGDFDGNGIDDIFWYGAGSRPDSIWWFDSNGRYASQSKTVTGDQYRPFAGDFDGDGHDDLFWYAPGPGKDYRWTKLTRGGSYSSAPTTSDGTYQPVVGDYDGNGVDDIIWYS